MKDISKTVYSSAPLRINDIGGWTDTWFAKEGFVLNMGIEPGTQVNIEVCSRLVKREERVRVCAANFNDSFLVNPENPDYGQHPMLQAAISSVPIPEDVELTITIHSQAPPGASMGTSASACVALLGALINLSGQSPSPHKIITLAHKVETEKLKMQSGIQDQICAAYGGINYIHMHRYPHAKVSPLTLTPSFLDLLESRLRLIYLGNAHNSSKLHEMVIKTLEKQGSALNRMKELPSLARSCLLNQDLTGFGEVMNRNTEYQRDLHKGLVCDRADRVIELAQKWGAVGWKVNGAGGDGGSMTLLGGDDEKKTQEMVREMKAEIPGLKEIPIILSSQGLQVS